MRGDIRSEESEAKTEEQEETVEESDKMEKRGTVTSTH